RGFAARESGTGPTLEIAYTTAPPSNSPPTVTITSPTNGQTFASSATVTITADASDADGSVTNVEFFDNGTSLGSDQTNPYSVTANLSVGTHTLTAIATDDQGA